MFVVWEPQALPKLLFPRDLPSQRLLRTLQLLQSLLGIFVRNVHQVLAFLASLRFLIMCADRPRRIARRGRVLRSLGVMSCEPLD